jgi:hypothetical protein
MWRGWMVHCKKFFILLFAVECLARRLGSILQIFHSLNQYDHDYRWDYTVYITFKRKLVNITDRRLCWDFLCFVFVFVPFYIFIDIIYRQNGSKFSIVLICTMKEVKIISVFFSDFPTGECRTKIFKTFGCVWDK